jgi:hypothetical protein
MSISNRIKDLLNKNNNYRSKESLNQRHQFLQVEVDLVIEEIDK